MSMQDKEFDQLFRTSFKDFEVQPSRGLWNSIANKIDNGKRRKLVARLSIAACLLLAASAGAYFLPGTPEQTVQQTAVIKHRPKAEAIITEPARTKNINKQSAVSSVAAVRSFKPIKKEKKTKSETAPMTVTATEQQDQLAQILPHREVLNAVVPDVDIPLIIKTDIDKPVTMSGVASVKPTNEPTNVLAAEPQKKHRIRSLGDLVNAVVGKIDKRKDKLIEFTTNDDDDAVVTGVNLGLVKIKKER